MSCVSTASELPYPGSMITDTDRTIETIDDGDGRVVSSGPVGETKRPFAGQMKLGPHGVLQPVINDHGASLAHNAKA